MCVCVRVCVFLICACVCVCACARAEGCDSGCHSSRNLQGSLRRFPGGGGVGHSFTNSVITDTHQMHSNEIMLPRCFFSHGFVVH